MALPRSQAVLRAMGLSLQAPSSDLQGPARGAVTSGGIAGSWKEMAEFLYRSAKEHARDAKKQPDEPRKGQIVVIVPAHNEEDVIADCIEGLLGQSRRPDRIVIAADNCGDRTVEIARRYRGVTVFETENNLERKAGALGQAWLRYTSGYEFVVGVDADSVLAPTCLAELEAELKGNLAVGGVMARYSLEQPEGGSGFSRLLVRMQRFEFAGWTVDILHRRRRTYVLGGQATMFRGEALVDVTRTKKRLIPWSHKSQVEDMELTWALHASGWETKISPVAKAYVGPMFTLRSFWAQRRKWDEGLVRLLLSAGINRATAFPWRMQLKLLLDLTIRVLFVILMCISLATHSYRWYWIWAIPPLLAVALNVRTLRRMPNATFGDWFAALTLVAVELYLWLRLAVWATSWLMVALGIRHDGWARQYEAEGKALPAAAPVPAASVPVIDVTSNGKPAPIALSNL